MLKRINPVPSPSPLPFACLGLLDSYLDVEIAVMSLTIYLLEKRGAEYGCIGDVDCVVRARLLRTISLDPGMAVGDAACG